MRFRTVAACCLVAFVVLTSVLLFYKIQADEPSKEPISQLRVDGDAQLVKANGVVRGGGTLNDPYVIDGWLIEVGSGPGIWVSNTTSHLIISNISFVMTGVTAIVLDDVYNCTVRDCSIYSFRDCGILVRMSPSTPSCGLRLIQNIVSSSKIGIDLWNASGIEISGNTVARVSTAGIRAYGCDGMTMLDNKLLNIISWESGVGNESSGLLLKECSQVYAEGNHFGEMSYIGWLGMYPTEEITIVNTTGVVLKDSNFQMSGDDKGLRINGSSDIEIISCRFEVNGGTGIQIDSTDRCTVKDCGFYSWHMYYASGLATTGSADLIVEDNRFYGCGIQSRYSENTSIQRNRLVSESYGLDYYYWHSGSSSIYTAFAVNLSIKDNCVVGSTGRSVVLSDSDRVNVSGNIIRDATYYSYSDGYGLYAYNVQNLSITGNRIGDNLQGSTLWWYSGEISLSQCDGAFIQNNTIVSDSIDIYDSKSPVIRWNILSGEGMLFLMDAPDGLIAGNSFLDSYNISLRNSDSTLLDDGYPIGGNYWDDLIGMDEFSGPNQDEPGPDGILDSGYYVGYGNDSYPLALEIDLIDERAPFTTPILLGNYWKNGWYTTNVTVNLTAQDAGNDNATIAYRLDSGEWFEYTAPFNITTCGRHTLDFFSTDAMNNVEDLQSMEVFVDKDQPFIETLSPVPESTFTKDVGTIRFHAIDNTSGVDVIGWAYWSYSIVSFLSLPEFEISKPENGNQTVYIVAIDEAGRWTSCQVTYYFDTDPMSLGGPYGFWFPAGLAADVVFGCTVTVYGLMWYISTTDFRKPPAPPHREHGVPKGPETKSDIENGYPKYVRKV